MCGIICLIQYGGGRIDLTQALQCLKSLKARGPDGSSYRIIRVSDDCEIFMGFTRLAIMDTSTVGMQPFVDSDKNVVVCNGEIYNYKKLARQYDIPLNSNCDCEILLPLFYKVGFEKMIAEKLDAEFAMIIYDELDKFLYIARDRYGVRPLYCGYNKNNKIIGFASELKALHPIMDYVEQMMPNYYGFLDLQSGFPENIEQNTVDFINFSQYYSFDNMYHSINLEVSEIQEKINLFLTTAVEKRLHSDRPIGFLLSGGLDSSLIVAIATKILGPEKIVCFSIGLKDSPDIEASKRVTEYLKIKNHHIVSFDVKTGLMQLGNVIQAIETYDITTIRASTPQYLLAKYINEKTNIRVLLSGEGSDEIHGSYRYFRDAANASEFHEETLRLLRELHYFDNQRTDRTMASWGLEIRVPFLDFDYVNFITNIDPALLMYRPDYMEKQLIRDSFKTYLPQEILYRSKEAFSDAVSSNKINWIDFIKEEANIKITDSDLLNSEHIYMINKPKTKDALYFRNIFSLYYPARDNIIPHYWLPRFQKQEIFDPSARILNCY